jgi:hypothetical protein
MKVFKVFVLAMFFSKAYQYATTNEKAWPKKSRKVSQEWNKACSNSNLPLRKLNILVKTR